MRSPRLPYAFLVGLAGCAAHGEPARPVARPMLLHAVRLRPKPTERFRGPR